MSKTLATVLLLKEYTTSPRDSLTFPALTLKKNVLLSKSPVPPKLTVLPLILTIWHRDPYGELGTPCGELGTV